jgi:outer membrane beta-barrel protein
MPVKLLGFLTSTLAAAALGVALCAGPARAQDKKPEAKAGDKPDAKPAEAAKRPSDAPPPNCLDRSITDELGASLRPRGVQKKTFLKRWRAELIGHGGIYASDLMSSSYLYGGAVAWWLYEDLGFEVSFDLSPVALDIDGPVAGFFGDQRFQKKTGYLGLANVLWSPVHFKLRTEGGGIVHGDGIFTIGGGRLFHDTAQGIAIDGGLIIEIYPTRWLSFRADFRDVTLVQEAVGETRYTHNLTAMMGIGLWIPFWFL